MRYRSRAHGRSPRYDCLCAGKPGFHPFIFVFAFRSLTVSPQPNTAATAAGAAGVATAPNVTTSLTRSQRLGEIIKAGPVGKFGRWYARVQGERPYRTQLLSSLVIYLCGDLSAQLLFPSEQAVNENQDASASAESKDEIENKPGFGSSYDPWRTVRHLIVGAGSSIPSYNWFWFLHNNFNFSSKLLSILTKVFVQQIVFTPVFNSYFFSVHSLLAGATFEETWERLKKALPVSVTNSVKLWPAVTAFSLMYVPPEFRNVFSGVIAVGWQTYLSWLNQKAAREVQQEEAAIETGSSSAMMGNLIPVAQTA
ncbi:hypothetical protein N7520_010027 [Penicillium odoratum]|uniref:uncharacterized protein n=1 Tax=Penicillium odoratum TaxID=1167516 RepID=UPI0025479B38|nr:uncharacterized protein N7520_010027 [Penicillium odoratum]KAJ5753110.1 hypothetical protein N7520_010027 [Penicillium odoratum]